MFINDKIAYVQLQKTAGTHIAAVLHSLAPGEYRAKHSPIREDVGDRLVLGSVRNPWDWYVSLWAYGCLGRGAIHTQLTYSVPAVSWRMARAAALHPALWYETGCKIAHTLGKDHREWVGYYADANNPDLFRAWLKALFSKRGKQYLMENYPVLPLRHVAGLMTFRFLQLHVDYGQWRRKAGEVRTARDIREIYSRHGIIDDFIRMESLESDLSAVLDRVGIAHAPDDLKSRTKTNTSIHRDAGWYYDQETIDLVAAHDFLIAETFNYAPPVTERAVTIANEGQTNG